MERKTLLKLGLVTFVLADIFLNGMNAAVFASGDGWQYYLSLGAFLLLAFAFAIAAPIIGFHHDATAQNKAFMAAMLSAALSVMSVYTAINVKSQLTVDTIEQRQRLELDLANKDQKIADCLASRFCISEDMRDEFRQKEQQLIALPSGTYAIDRNSIEHKLKLAMFVLIALLCPFVSSEFSRQMGLNSVPTGTKAVPTVPTQGTETKKRGTEKRTWDDKQHQKLENAWKKLERECKKITLDNLQEESGVSRSLCSLYKRGGGPKNLPLRGQILSFPQKD